MGNILTQFLKRVKWVRVKMQLSPEGLIDFSGIPIKRGFEVIIEISYLLRGGLKIFSCQSLGTITKMISGIILFVGLNILILQFLPNKLQPPPPRPSTVASK